MHEKYFSKSCYRKNKEYFKTMNDDLSYFKNIDEAIEHFQSKSNAELFSFLSDSDEVKNQIALLNIQNISSIAEAEKIVFTLTEHSSETREYCAFLVNRLMKQKENQKYFSGDLIFKKFEKAIFDVNPKVCRKILEILPYYKDLEKLFPTMIQNSFSLIAELQEKNKDKNYQYNTKSFHLYWHIFAIGITMNNMFFRKYYDKLISLIEQLSAFNEYTLREKAAFLSNKMIAIECSDALKELVQKLQNDENFYVKESIINNIN